MTNTGGRGMYEAGVDARNQVLKYGADKFNADLKTTYTAADDLDRAA